MVQVQNTARVRSNLWQININHTKRKRTLLFLVVLNADIEVAETLEIAAGLIIMFDLLPNE
jgi:hypothetical protein